VAEKRWIAINKLTGVEYGPFNDAYKGALLAATETRHVYNWKEVTTNMVAPTEEMKLTVKAAKKNNLAEGSTDSLA
jgi:hypothetical protein